MKKITRSLGLLLSLCLLLGMTAMPVFASTFTDAHGNVIELDDSLEAYTDFDLKGANNAARRAETNLGDLWADALRWYAVTGKLIAAYDEDDIKAGNDKIDVDADHIVALWNGGNLRADIPAGKFGAAELAQVLPYPNRIAIVYMTGEMLMEALEAAYQGVPCTSETLGASASFMQVSGMNIGIDLSVPFEKGEEYKAPWYRAASLKRVTIFDINGKPCVPDDIYAVITSNANFNGMDSSYMFKEAAEANDHSTISTAVVRDAVWEFISEEMNNHVYEDYKEPQNRIFMSNTPFEDVEGNFTAVANWALLNGITEGTSANKFSPDKTVTRGQAVTFLWRAAGSPQAAEDAVNPFEDVTDSAYYYDAVLWAAANGITEGTTPTTFRPEQTLNREQMMTFLYRFIKLQGSGFTGLWSFNLDYEDADQISEYAYEPFCWLTMNGLYEAEGSKLLPKDACPRSLVVQMLFNNFNQ